MVCRFSPAWRVAWQTGARQIRFRRRTAFGRREGRWSEPGLVVHRLLNPFVRDLDPLRRPFQVLSPDQGPNVSLAGSGWSAILSLSRV